METIKFIKIFPKIEIEFQEKFKDEASCEKFMFEIKWGSGFKCSKCGHTEYWEGKDGMYICKKCQHQHSLKSGTIMHKSKKDLLVWFKAIWLFISSKHGINAKDMERQLGLSYPTAWTWHKKLQNSAFNEERTKLNGEVEVDEFYLVGKKGDKTKVEDQKINIE